MTFFCKENDPQEKKNGTSCQRVEGYRIVCIGTDKKGRTVPGVLLGAGKGKAERSVLDKNE